MAFASTSASCPASPGHVGNSSHKLYSYATGPLSEDTRYTKFAMMKGFSVHVYVHVSGWRPVHLAGGWVDGFMMGFGLRLGRRFALLLDPRYITRMLPLISS